MAPVSPSPLRTAVLAGAWLLAAAIALHFLASAHARYAQPDPAAYGMFWTRRHWLWVHLAGGVLAMVLGSVQFIGGLRRRWPRVHLWIGRTYLLGVCIGLVGAVALIAASPAPIAMHRLHRHRRCVGGHREHRLPRDPGAGTCRAIGAG